MAENQIAHFKVVLIGGSAGSISVLMQLLPQLDKISFALVLVLHRKSGEDSTLEELISLKTTVPSLPVEDKTKLLPGHVFVAPADYHLLFEKDNQLSLDISEKINHSRPSIDVSFESAADAFGAAVVGILLSGANNDGTAGLQYIKNAGGNTIVQNPETAESPFMPQHAIVHAEPNQILNIDGILAFLKNL